MDIDYNHYTTTAKRNLVLLVAPHIVTDGKISYITIRNLCSAPITYSRNFDRLDQYTSQVLSFMSESIIDYIENHVVLKDFDRKRSVHISCNIIGGYNNDSVVNNLPSKLESKFDYMLSNGQQIFKNVQTGFNSTIKHPIKHIAVSCNTHTLGDSFINSNVLQFIHMSDDFCNRNNTPKRVQRAVGVDAQLIDVYEHLAVETMKHHKLAKCRQVDSIDILESIVQQHNELKHQFNELKQEVEQLRIEVSTLRQQITNN